MPAKNPLSSVSSLSASSSDSSMGSVGRFLRTRPVSLSDGSIKLSSSSRSSMLPLLVASSSSMSSTDARRDVDGVNLVDVAGAAFLWEWESESGVCWIGGPVRVDLVFFFCLEFEADMGR
jgi:hypothetical protein